MSATAITADLVNKLRKRTGVGMMECKKALTATHGDIELAIEELRKSGKAKADKKAGRVAAEGIVTLQVARDGKRAVLIEINSETDFVARDENFLNFTKSITQLALDKSLSTLDDLLSAELDGHTVEELRQNLVAKVGENISVRRIALTSADAKGVGTYIHGNRIGVWVELDSDNTELAKDIAMHVAASKPLVVNPSEVDPEIVNKEKEIFTAQASSSGKPQDIVEKMVAGRLKKFLDEVSLLGQAFVKDPNIVVSDLLNKHRVKVNKFVRFEVGEGIEKEEENFVEAVMSQVQNG